MNDWINHVMFALGAKHLHTWSETTAVCQLLFSIYPDFMLTSPYKGILIQTSAGFFRLPNSRPNFSLLALQTKLKGSSWHSKLKKKLYIILEWHASLVVVTLASQHEGLGVRFTDQLVSFCVESTYTPHALRVHRLPPTVQRRLVCGVNWWL